MKPGDIVRVVFLGLSREKPGLSRFPDRALGIYLRECARTDSVTGEEYPYAEVMWFHNNKVATCEFYEFDKVTA